MEQMNARYPNRIIEFKPSLPPRCFLAGTPILLADGSATPIETILAGDVVAAFAGGGDFDGARGLTAALEPRPVARLFSNVTTEIIAITYGEADGVVIPGRGVIPDFAQQKSGTHLCVLFASAVWA